MEPRQSSAECNSGDSDGKQMGTLASLGEKSSEGMGNVCKILALHWDISWCSYKSLALSANGLVCF